MTTDVAAHGTIRERIARFERWHYEFDLGGVKTPIFDPDSVRRHEERRAYFFDPLVRLLGGTLAGKRVLDLGCNAGWWSLLAIEAGCDFVAGIDGRPAHIDQARLVFETKGVDPRRYRFIHGDLTRVDLEREGPFDVVLALGIFYHISKPFELLERIAVASTDVLVIDTAISKASGSFFELVREPIDEPRNAIDRELVLWPTLPALLEAMREFHYRVQPLEPRFGDWKGSEDYRRGLRRAVVGARRTDLTPLRPLASTGVEPGRGAGTHLLAPTDLSGEAWRSLLAGLGMKALRALGFGRQPGP